MKTTQSFIMVCALATLAGSADSLGVDNSIIATPQPESLFNSVRQSLVLVKTKTSAGTGFIVKMEKSKYLVTNEHVVRGGVPLTFQLLSGGLVKTGQMEIANDLDLVRFLITDDYPSLELSGNMPVINQVVHVYGDSDGAGVTTSLMGQILGVGPDRVEVSADFVKGNSGSPVVDGQGLVIGVATYATKQNDANDWLKTGTRFNDVRRFALRPQAASWVPIESNRYFARADALADLGTYSQDVYDLLFGSKYTSSDSPGASYTTSTQSSRYRRFPKLCEQLATVAKIINDHDKKILDSNRALDQFIQEGRGGRRATYNPNAVRDQVAWNEAVRRSERKKFIDARSQLVIVPNNLFRKVDWVSTRLCDESQSLLALVDFIVEAHRKKIPY